MLPLVEVPDDLVTLCDSGSSESLLRVLKGRIENQQPNSWIGDSLLSFRMKKATDIRHETYDDKSKSYYVDPELEQSPPHPFSLANRCLQNICKGCEKNQTIILQGKDDITKRKIQSDIRYFLLENSFPKIDQTPFDNIDFVLSILTTSLIPPLGQNIEASLVTSLTFGTVNHNLISAQVDIKTLDLSRLTSTETEDGTFLMTNVFLCALHSKLLAGIFTPYGDQSKYTFAYQPVEPLDKETQSRYSAYFSLFQSTLLEIGVTSVQLSEIFRVIMAILLLGNLMFTTERGKTVIRNVNQIKSVCQMIGCSSPQRMIQLLCADVPPEGAVHRRDYLAQLWYCAVIDYITSLINNYYRSRFGLPSPKASTRTIHILHVPAYDYRKTTPSGMLQLHRNYTAEWIFHFYYSDMFSTEYRELQEVQNEATETRFPDNSNVLNAFLDLDTNQNNGLLYVVDSSSEDDSSAIACCVRLAKGGQRKVMSVLKEEKIQMSHFSSELSIQYDIREILYTNQCPLPAELVYSLNSSCIIPLLSNWKSDSWFLSYIQRIQSDTNFLIRLLVDSEHLYSNSTVYTPQTEDQFLEEIRIMELQPLIQVHKFGYPLQLDFVQFLDCFKSLDSEEVKKASQSDREHCLAILQSIPSLRPTDYIVSNSKVFLKHDKERVMVSALWEKNGRNQRSYSRSRAQTCGELFPRGIGTSNLLEIFAKQIETQQKIPHRAHFDTSSEFSRIVDSESLRFDAVEQQGEEMSQDDVEIVVERETSACNIQNEREMDELEGKGRALLVMLSTLGQYDRMIPILRCMRVLFSSPMPEDMTIHDSYLLQLSRAIESFQFASHQSEAFALNYFEPHSSQQGGVYGELRRLQCLMDEFYNQPNDIIQFHKATEFAQLAKRRIEHELYTEAHYRNYDFIIRLVKCFALLWKRSDPLDEVRCFLIEEGVLEALLILLSDPTSALTLKYVIGGLLKLFSSFGRFQQWFARGNGTRCVLQVLSHFYSDSSESIRCIAEYRDSIPFLYHVLLALSKEEKFVQSLVHVIRFHRVSDSYNLPIIFTKAIPFHSDPDTLLLLLKLIENFAPVYGPSNEYLHAGLIQALVQLLDDTRLYYQVGCTISILFLPEYMPTGDMESCMKGAISLLLKHLLLSAPSSLRLIHAHYDSYTFAISQLAHYSSCCKGETRQLLGESTLHCLLQGDQVARTEHVLQKVKHLQRNPVASKALLEQCSDFISSHNLNFSPMNK